MQLEPPVLVDTSNNRAIGVQLAMPLYTVAGQLDETRLSQINAVLRARR